MTQVHFLFIHLKKLDNLCVAMMLIANSSVAADAFYK